MRTPDFVQIVDTLNLGVLVLDDGAVVRYWNRWMERASGLRAEEVLGRALPDLFPETGGWAFTRNFRSVLNFGILAVFSPRLHGQLFPLAPSLPSSGLGFMPQRCVLGPLREDGAIVGAYLTVEDLSEAWQKEQRLGGLAMRDGLTGVYNRRYLDRRLEEEFERARRHGTALGFIMVDIDRFKGVNDENGHQFGDEALRVVAQTCQRVLRITDLLARYGGEEFSILLPDTGLEAGRLLAERLRAAVEARPVEAFGKFLTVTVSAGVSSLRHDDSPAALIERADTALYRAKNLGRNRVEAEA